MLRIPFFVVLGFEFRVYNLSHSTSPYLRFFFKISSCELFVWTDFDHDPPDLCLLRFIGMCAECSDNLRALEVLGI
jgi:hypothetical protein